MMTENTPEVQISAVVEAWNAATSGRLAPLNAYRMLLQGEFCTAILKAEIKPDEVTTVARYIIYQNARASDQRFVKPLNLFKLVCNIAEFESILGLARHHFRNNALKSAKQSVVDSFRQFEEPPKDGAQRVSVDLIAQALKQTKN